MAGGISGSARQDSESGSHLAAGSQHDQGAAQGGNEPDQFRAGPSQFFIEFLLGTQDLGKRVVRFVLLSVHNAVVVSWAPKICRPKGATTDQPRATPWVKVVSPGISLERAKPAASGCRWDMGLVALILCRPFRA